MSSIASHEIELQLGANHRIDSDLVRHSAAAMGLRLRERRELKFVDTWLDTPDLELARSGRGLRIRRVDGRRLLTLKTEVCTSQQFVERDELEVELVGPVPDRVTRLPPGIFERLRSLDGARLRPIAVLRTKRRVLSPIRAPATIEVCLDDVRVFAPNGRPLGTFHDLEIELKTSIERDAWTDLADELRRSLGLHEVRDNKLVRALVLLGVRLEIEPVARPRAETPVCIAARTALLACIAELESESVRVVERGSVRAVHRLRVACRRARVVAGCFADVVQDSLPKRLIRHCRRTARALTTVRELDVMIADFGGELGGLPPAFAQRARSIRRRLAERRAEAIRSARRRLQSARHAKELVRLRERLVNPIAGDTTPLVDFAPDRVRSAFAGVHEVLLTTRRLDDDEIHHLRLALKYSRYLAELFAPVFGKTMSRFAERIAALQDVTGRQHDAVAMVARLTRLSQKRQGLRRKQLPTLGALAMIADLRADAARVELEFAIGDFLADEPQLLLEAILSGSRAD